MSSSHSSLFSELPSGLPAIQPWRILITGGTGFIGRPLVTLLHQYGCPVVVLTRNPSRAKEVLPEGVTAVGSLAEIPPETVFDVLINLAGESLAQGRWTSAKKQRLLDSRIGTTKHLLEWASRQTVSPKYLINGSAVGYYGPQGDTPLTELSAPNPSFSHQLCAQWEDAALSFEKIGTAVCRLRQGVVLEKNGGAFEQIILPYKFKLATVIGTGRQYFSWIHQHDLLRLFFHLLSQDSFITGPINATAPEPVTYRALAKTLGEQRNTWLTLPAPAFMMRLALGEMADELLLTGQRVIPQRLKDLGFKFDYPDWESAVRKLV